MALPTIIDTAEALPGMRIRWTERLHALAGQRWKDVVCVLVLSVLTLLTWIPRHRGPIDLRWDGAVYYVLGTSLAEGKGYRLLNEPGEISAVQYPPLLPAVVALQQRVLGTSDPVIVGRSLRITWIVLSLIYVVLTFFLGRSFLPRHYAFFLALICLASYQMFFLATLLFAELPYAFTTTLFAVLYYKKGQGELARAGAGASAIASYLLRTLGIAVLAAWVLDALLRRRFRSAALRAAVALVPIAMWQGHIHHVESGYRYTHPFYSYQRDPSLFYNVSYAKNVSLKSPFQPALGKASFGDLFTRGVGNVVTTPDKLGESIAGDMRMWGGFLTMSNGERRLPFLWWRPTRLTFLLIGGLVVGGIGLMLWERQWAIGLYLLLSLAALLSSPWPGQTLRYLAPLLPFSLLAMLVSIRRLQELGRKHLGKVGGLGASALTAYLVVFVLTGSALTFSPWYNHRLSEATYQSRDGVDHPYTLVYYSPAYASLSAAYQWLRTRAAADAVIGNQMPAWAYVETGHKAVMPPLIEAPATIQRLLDSVPVSYMVMDHTAVGTDNSLIPSLLRNSVDKWRMVYSSAPNGVEIYQRIGLDTLRHLPGTR